MQNTSHEAGINTKIAYYLQIIIKYVNYNKL